jgi:hypothetical protein
MVPHCSGKSEPLADVLQVYSDHGKLDVTLTVEVYRFVNAMFSMNVRAFCYQDVCSYPGPTMFVKPGDTVRYFPPTPLENCEQRFNP